MRSKSEELMMRIVGFIEAYYFDKKCAPTLQEIADSLGYSKSCIGNYVQAMIENGMLDNSNGWRSVRTPKMMKAKTDGRFLPVVGAVACGTPILAEENIESYFSFSAQMLGQGEFFILRAKGNSMIGANIEDGDLVIVRQQDTAKEGEIVVALVNDEATLKRYYVDKRKKKIRLHPENPELSDMYFDKVDIQGVAIKVMKDVK